MINKLLYNIEFRAGWIFLFILAWAMGSYATGHYVFAILYTIIALAVLGCSYLLFSIRIENKKFYKHDRQ